MHGAIINYVATQGFYDRNDHGCWAHAEGDLSENGCGAAVQAAFQCGVASCSGCLPATTQAALDDLNACHGASEGWPVRRVLHRLPVVH